MKLNQHLEEEVVSRLMLLQTSQRNLFPTWSNALDALERELKHSETLVEQVEKIESSLSDLTSLFQEKMEEASVDEGSRLGGAGRLREDNTSPGALRGGVL